MWSCKNKIGDRCGIEKVVGLEGEPVWIEARKYCSPFVVSRLRKCIQGGRDNTTRIIVFVRPTTRTHLKSREVTGPGIEPGTSPIHEVSSNWRHTKVYSIQEPSPYIPQPLPWKPKNFEVHTV